MFEFFGVVLSGLFGGVSRVFVGKMLMAMRLIGMMAGILVLAFLVQPGGMFVMLGSRAMVLRSLGVMLGRRVFICHLILR